MRLRWALPTQFCRAGRRIAKGNMTPVAFGEQLWMKALTRVTASREPQNIDYLYLDGPAANQVQQGILCLKGMKCSPLC